MPIEFDKTGASEADANKLDIFNAALAQRMPATQQVDVRFGSLAYIDRDVPNVRFTPESGH